MTVLAAPPGPDPLFARASARLLVPRPDYLAQPGRWALDRLDNHLWSKQRDILASIRDNPRTAVPSCHSSGKSHTAATAACWWIDAHPPGSAMVISTAPTGAQVKAILWRYIGKMHRAADPPLPGRVNLVEWYIGRELVGLGRKPADHDTAGFSGYHAEFLLVIIDEASGVAKDIWDAVSTLVAGGHGRVLAIGNPDLPTGEFAEVCRPDSGWNVIPISAFDTPNFTGEDVPVKVASQLASRDWVEDRARRWGEDSALYQAKVLGEFPKQGSPFAVVPHDAATRCRYLDLPEGEPVEAGIDVGAGGDRTIIRERRGQRAGRSMVFRDADPMRTVGLLAGKLKEWGITRAKVDVAGIGWGIVGRLKELSSVHNPGSKDTTHDAEIVAVNFGEGPTRGKEKRFLNRRAEVWWEVGRERSRLGTWDLSEVDDDVIHELTAPEYQVLDSFGKIKIEPKPEVKKRLGMSPDEADALLLAFWEGSGGVVEAPAARAFAGRSLLAGMKPGEW